MTTRILRVSFLILVFLGTFPVMAQSPLPISPMIGRGSKQLSIGGRLDEDGNDFGLALNGRGGLFIEDLIQVGGFGSLAFRGSDTKSLTLGVFGEYSFFIESQLVPYVGGGLGLGWFDTVFRDETFLELTVWGGARFFFVDHAALGAELILYGATEDVYNHGRDAVDWAIRVVTSWYFY